MFNGGQHRQYTGEVTVTATLSSTEEAFTILPEDMEVVTPMCVEESKWIQLPYSFLLIGFLWAPNQRTSA
jgi:hypothetical protein